VNARHRAVFELIVAGAALVATTVSWLNTRSTVAVAPVVDGQPPTMSVIYDPALLVLTLMLATVAGIFAVLGIVGIVRLNRVVRSGA
jgi:hypothetical protein